MKARSSDPPKAPVRKAKKAPSGGDSRLQGVWGCESRPPGAFGIGGSGISSCSSVGADLGLPSSTKTLFLSREGRPRSPPTGMDQHKFLSREGRPGSPPTSANRKTGLPRALEERVDGHAGHVEHRAQGERAHEHAGRAHGAPHLPVALGAPGQRGAQAGHRGHDGRDGPGHRRA